MSVTNYIYDGNQYLAEADETDTINRLYTNEPDAYTHLISQEEVSTGETLTYHDDAVGSTRTVTDETEAVTDEFTYDAWGNRLSRTGTNDIPFQYVGEHGYYREDATDSYYVMARTYQPSTGRWGSMDPLGFVDGLNVYGYVSNRPLLLIDPSGLLCKIGIHCFGVDHKGYESDILHCGLTITTDQHFGEPKKTKGSPFWLDFWPTRDIPIPTGGPITGGINPPNHFLNRPVSDADQGDELFYPDSTCRCLKNYYDGFINAKTEYTLLNRNSNWSLRCLTEACQVSTAPDNTPWNVDPVGWNAECCQKYGIVGGGLFGGSGLLTQCCVEWGLCECPKPPFPKPSSPPKRAPKPDRLPSFPHPPSRGPGRHAPYK
ncbi:MAG: RHS repeat-associated core domain-containing protein [Planctomycetaceae bacterium]|nr:RHS repeat-associated core domain-containing protein [Planctomycetaceae bacterium]